MKIYLQNLDGTSNERFAYDLKDAFQMLSTLCWMDQFEEAIVYGQDGTILGAFHCKGIKEYKLNG